MTLIFLSLGDRHLENILIDSETGMAVHIDFGILLEKGLSLACPEIVPFRLTHNLIDAMGVLGYEGTFRKTCEVTLALLREQKDILMTVLDTFVHDPLVDWSKARSSRIENPLEIIKSAENQMLKIKKKLNGQVEDLTQRGTMSNVLNVQGQVEYLIKQATDTDNLGLMYTWWSPYL